MVQNTETNHCNTPHSQSKEGGKNHAIHPSWTQRHLTTCKTLSWQKLCRRETEGQSISARKAVPWGKTAGSPWAGGWGRRPSFPPHCRGHGAALGRRKGIWIGKDEAKPHHHVSRWHENPEESPKPAGAKKQVQQSLRIWNWQKQVVSRHEQWTALFLLTTKI